MMILDMDTLVSPTLAEQILKLVIEAKSNQSLWNTVFKFNRKVINNDKHKKHKVMHPSVCLIEKKYYWKAGGCEEDLVGHYGFTDPCFWNRVSRVNINIKYLQDKCVHFNPNAEADINRE